MATAVGQGATGNAYIDGLLSGTKWSGSFTYSFPQLASQYQAGNEETATFTPVSLQQREATRAILTGDTYFATSNVITATSVNSFVSVAVTEAGGLGNGLNGNGDIRLGQSPNADPTAYAYYPSNAANGEGGDVWFGDDYAGTVNDYRNPVAGGYAYHTHIHELGHAMGLKHSHEGGGVAGAIPADRDSIEFTVMSYRSYVGGPSSGGYTYGTWDAPQTFMQYDIQALQEMYGAWYGSASNNTNSTYTWNNATGEMSINGVGQGTPGGNKVFLTVWDGGGIDTYDMSNYSNDVSINLAPGSWSITSDAQRANLGAGHQANGNVYNSFLYHGNLASIIENAVGGSGDDNITGNQVANVLSGRDGDDTLAGLDGNDTLNGENGGDLLKGGGGADTLSGMENDDTLMGGDGADALLGGNGFDIADYSDASAGVSIDLAAGTAAGNVANGDILSSIEGIRGSIYSDTLRGDALANRLEGRDGNDTLNGRAGADTIVAGDGDDTIVINTGDHSPGEQYDGGNGNDRLLVESSADFRNVDLTSFEEVEFSAAVVAAKTAHFAASQIGAGLSATAVIDGAFIGQQDILKVSLGSATSVDLSDLTFVDWDAGGSENDQVQINGSAASDLIAGSVVADIVTGAAGNDTIGGGAGDDSLSGGAGNDTLSGGAGFDTMVGGAGDDTFASIDGNDTIVEAGGGGNDTLNSAVTVTALVANVEDLLLTGAAAINGTGNGLDNSITGNGAANILDGASGFDTVVGGGGNDSMNGGGDNDRLNGSNGNDQIDGGIGNDTLAGGANADSFVFDSVLNAATNVDRVVDFTGADTIVLENAIFTGIGAALNATEFTIGAAAADVSDRIIYNSVTGNMFFDADGAGGAAQVRFAILSTGLALTNADFVMI